MSVSARAINKATTHFVPSIDELQLNLASFGDLVVTGSGLALDTALNQAKYNFPLGAQSLLPPSALGDYTNKQYVDNLVGGLSWKEPVRVASLTVEITVTSPGAVIDGVAMNLDDRVLLNNQTDSAENGIFQWKGAATPMIRPTDFPTGGDATNAAMFVSEGTYADEAYTQNQDPAIIDTDALNFVQFAGSGGTIIAGAGITQVGNIFNVVAADDSLLVNADDMRVKFSNTVPGLETADSGVRIAAAIAGNGLTGGGGVVLSVQPDSAASGDTTAVYVIATGVGINVTQLDGDHLRISWNPTNYTPTVAPAETNNIDDLTAHLAGIDAAIGATDSGMKIERNTLDAGEVGARQVSIAGDVTDATACWFEYLGTLLSHDGSAVQFTPGTGGSATLNWSGTSGAGSPAVELQAGDEIVIHYR